MSNIKNLGTCERCGEIVMSVRDRKDHTVGDISHAKLHRYKAGDRL